MNNQSFVVIREVDGSMIIIHTSMLNPKFESLVVFRGNYTECRTFFDPKYPTYCQFMENEEE